jgi:hypothetical protein
MIYIPEAAFMQVKLRGRTDAVHHEIPDGICIVIDRIKDKEAIL